MNNHWFLVLWVIGHVLYSLGALYYLLVSVPAYVKGRRDYVQRSAPGIDDITRLMGAKGATQVPLFKFQITTLGNEIHVVSRGIKSILTLAEEPLFQNRLSIDVVTEETADEKALREQFPDCALPLNIHVVPRDYRTRNNTLKKARALHYMIELREQEEGVERGYIVYLDSESVMKPVDFKRLVYATIKSRKRITEGPIVYPLRWFEAHVISRQMEATRPWHCYHCHEVMVNPPPQHIHGSNLVVEENMALEFGWDFGNLDGQPLVAEDLVFGLLAYVRYGKEVFGWHGAELLEQPPMSVRDSVRQRIRWVGGIWQALEMLKRSGEFGKLPLAIRLKIRMKIGLRATLYSLGFFSACFFFIFFFVWLANLVTDVHYLDLSSFWVFLWSFLLIPGLIIWLGSTQIGLSRILERTNTSRKKRTLERLKILAITPVAALVETSGAMYATARWFLGLRKVEWTPTKK